MNPSALRAYYLHIIRKASCKQPGGNKTNKLQIMKKGPKDASSKWLYKWDIYIIDYRINDLME